MTKRKRFLLSSTMLSLGFVGIQIFQDEYRFYSISFLGLLTVLFFAWSLYENLGRNMTLSILILPLFFTVGVGFFWFLLPANIFTQIPVVLFYALGIYALCLTMNIYTVSTTRTIALLRAARGVGFVLTLVTLFLIFDTIISMKMTIFLTSILVFGSSFPLFLQGLWSMKLDKDLSREVLLMSIVSAFALFQLAVIIHFWPVTVVVGSLFLTVGGYILLGLGQAKLEARLFTQTIREHLLLGSFVLLGMFFATRWGG